MVPAGVTEATLFPLPDPEPTYRELSPTARRTVRRQQLLEAGIHPASRLRVVPDSGERCATCVHLHLRHSPAGRRFWKCDLNPRHPWDSAGAATDVRRGWPACEAWEEPWPE